MAKSTNTPSKTTARTTGKSTAKKTAAPKSTTSSRATASNTTKKTEEQKPTKKVSPVASAKTSTPLKKATVSSATPTSTKRTSGQKTTEKRTSPAPNKRDNEQNINSNRSTSSIAKKETEQKDNRNPERQNTSTLRTTPTRQTDKKPTHQLQQNRTQNGPAPSRNPNNPISNLRDQSPVRPMPKRPEQRTQHKPQPNQWQQQNWNAPSQSTPPPPPKQDPKNEPPQTEVNIKLDQSVAILIDGNNIEMSLHSVSKNTASMINFDKLIPYLLGNRALSRLIYFREGKSISPKLAERLQKMFHGSVVPCHKSADIPLSIKAVQVASKVDTIIILSGDADYVELVRHLKHDGIRVEIAAFPETTADILRQESDYFFPITVDFSFALK